MQFENKTYEHERNDILHSAKIVTQSKNISPKTHKLILPYNAWEVFAYRELIHGYKWSHRQKDEEWQGVEVVKISHEMSKYKLD